MSAEAPVSTGAPRQAWKSWNQRLHVYLGLYFLVFLWLFAVSGLLLNHAWRFAEFWPQREQSTREERVTVSRATSDLVRAQEVMRQLGLAGEIQSTTVEPASQRLDFRVQRPGRTTEVRVDLEKQTATIHDIRVNGWGIFRALHTFTGARANIPDNARNWWLTKLWSFAMDALAAGLVLLVITSVTLAVERRARWMGSGVALALGVLACGFFLFGLRWL